MKAKKITKKKHTLFVAKRNSAACVDLMCRLNSFGKLRHRDKVEKKNAICKLTGDADSILCLKP